MDNNFLLIIDLLRNDGSIIVNKSLAHSIGVKEAIVYSELLSKYIYFAKKDQITEQGYFFNTIPNLQKDTALTRRQQDSAIKNLLKFGLIDRKNIGVPPRRYFKIIPDFENIKKYLVSKETSQFVRNGQIDESKKTSQFVRNGQIELYKTDKLMNSLGVSPERVLKSRLKWG